MKSVMKQQLPQVSDRRSALSSQDDVTIEVIMPPCNETKRWGIGGADRTKLQRQIPGDFGLNWGAMDVVWDLT